MAKKEIMYLGPVPNEEDCVQVGALGYYDLALVQCERFIKRIREYCGVEPTGARLYVKTNHHDMGEYLEVECSYDPDNETAAKYAYEVEGNGPVTWEDD